MQKKCLDSRNSKVLDMAVDCERNNLSGWMYALDYHR